MSLEVGQRVRIEGKEFTVADVKQSMVWGKRNTRLQLTLTEDVSPQDAKPSQVNEAINNDIKRLNLIFTPFMQKLSADYEAYMAKLNEGIKS